jgi:DNA-directed RNA polymerase subunit L
MQTEVTKFSSQANPLILDQLRKISKEDGRVFQAVLEDAMKLYIETRNSNKPRKIVADAFEASLKEFDSLYTELAK